MLYALSATVLYAVIVMCLKHRVARQRLNPQEHRLVLAAVKRAAEEHEAAAKVIELLKAQLRNTERYKDEEKVLSRKEIQQLKRELRESKKLVNGYRNAYGNHLAAAAKDDAYLDYVRTHHDRYEVREIVENRIRGTITDREREFLTEDTRPRITDREREFLTEDTRPCITDRDRYMPC